MQLSKAFRTTEPKFALKMAFINDRNSLYTFREDRQNLRQQREGATRVLVMQISLLGNEVFFTGQ